MRRALGRALVLAGALGASVGGCLPYVHDPDYPKEWSALAASVGADCSGLSGTYENQGITTQLWRPIGLRRLSLWVCAAADPEGRGPRPAACDGNAPVTRVQLAVDGPRLRAELLDDDNHATRLELSPAFTASCDGRRLSVKGTVVPRCGGCVVVSHAFASLYRSLDDSLVLHDGDTTAGSVMLLFNAVGYEADWARFRATEPGNSDALEPWPEALAPWTTNATWFGGPEGVEVLLWRPIRPPPGGTLELADEDLEFRPDRSAAWRLHYRDIREVATETPAANAATDGSARPSPPSLLHPPERPLPVLVARLTLENGRSVGIDAGSPERTQQVVDRILAHLARGAATPTAAQPSPER